MEQIQKPTSTNGDILTEEEIAKMKTGALEGHDGELIVPDNPTILITIEE